jgi:hypothetical protein
VTTTFYVALNGEVTAITGRQAGPVYKSLYAPAALNAPSWQSS